MTPTDKDRLIAEHLEPNPEWLVEFSITGSHSKLGCWLARWSSNGGLEFQHPRSMLESEMTLILIVKGKLAFDGEGCIGILHNDGYHSEDSIVLREFTVDAFSEAVRDAYIAAFNLG